MPPAGCQGSFFRRRVGARLLGKPKLTGHFVDGRLGCRVRAEMEESDLDRELVDVAGELVALSRRDRDALLQELALTAGHRAMREKFETAGEHRAVELDREERAELRATLEAWERDGLPPNGIAPLLAALVRAEQSG